MRQFNLFIVSVLVFCTALLIFAGAPRAQHGQTEPSALEPTRIETDSESGQIQFYIKGELVAVLKEDGLHVREGMSYGGTLLNYGYDSFDKLYGNNGAGLNNRKADPDAQ